MLGNFKFPDFTRVKILVVGDLMLDLYWSGNVSRISPEAPVPVVHIKDTKQCPGGASNVALNVASLGCKAILCGVLGRDIEARQLTDLLKKAHVDCCFQCDDNFSTIKKLRVLAQNQQLIRLDFEEKSFEFDFKSLISLYSEKLPEADLVIISDYGKGIFNCIPELIKKARSLNVPVLVDPKGTDFKIYEGASIITPNMSEFEAVVGVCGSEAELVEKGLNLIKKNKLHSLLVTRGKDGMTLIENEKKKPFHISSQALNVYDVTGAGDTVISVLGCVLASGGDIVSSVKIANLAAGLVVSKLGAATVSVSELRRGLRRQQNATLGIVDEKTLMDEIEDARSNGEIIVMTNGCFDILHAGHISYLEQAKRLGTRLLVAVNDDASVKRLKGNERPVNNLEQRMSVLAGLRCVDWVVPFSGDTPLSLIKKVMPDVLVKGGDWKTDEIVGSEDVLKNGGRVESLSFVENQSTSEIINRIRGKEK